MEFLSFKEELPFTEWLGSIYYYVCIVFSISYCTWFLPLKSYIILRIHWEKYMYLNLRKGHSVFTGSIVPVIVFILPHCLYPSFASYLKAQVSQLCEILSDARLQNVTMHLSMHCSWGSSCLQKANSKTQIPANGCSFSFCMPTPSDIQFPKRPRGFHPMKML